MSSIATHQNTRSEGNCSRCAGTNANGFPGVQISLCEPQSLNEGLGDWVSRDGVNLASTGGRYPRGILWPASPPTIHFRQNDV
jgi:hypothetical protein